MVSLQLLEAQFLILAVGTATGLEQEDVLTGRSDKDIIAFAAFNNVVFLEEGLSGRIHPIAIGTKEPLDELGVDCILGNGITSFTIHAILQGRHAARKDNINFRTTDQIVSTLTADESNCDGGVSRRDSVVTGTTVHGGKLSTNFQEVIMSDAHELVGKAANSRAIKCIIGGVNIKALAICAHQSPGAISGVDDDFGLTKSTVISLREDNMAGVFAVDVIVLQRGCSDVVSLGTERNIGSDCFCTVDQPVRTGNGVGKSIINGVSVGRTGTVPVASLIA